MLADLEYQAIAMQVCALSFNCVADPVKTVDLLTGYLWDEEEARKIKKHLVPIT
jgi:hypothetical protein